MEPEKKQSYLDWINSATYEQLFRKIRFDPIGSEFFSDADIYQSVKDKMKLLEDDYPNLRSQTSKAIGW